MLMPSIKDIINKIKWDRSEDPKDYSLYYLDRITKSLRRIMFSEIERMDGNFIVLNREGEETNIPLHRIRIIKKKNVSVGVYFNKFSCFLIFLMEADITILTYG